MKDCDVLIVEDDVLVLKFYTTAFETFLPDCSFQAATSGEAVLSLLDDYKFKLALIDIGLAGKMTGVDLALFLKEKNPDTILYAVTGLPHIFDKFDPGIAGFNAIYDKSAGYKSIFKAVIDDLGIDLKVTKH